MTDDAIIHLELIIETIFKLKDTFTLLGTSCAGKRQLLNTKKLQAGSIISLLRISRIIKLHFRKHYLNVIYYIFLLFIIITN